MSGARLISPSLIKQRDFSLISGIELDFFTSLSTCGKHFKGSELPGDWSCTVAAALNAAQPFVNSSGNDLLDVVVCFDVSDCCLRNRKHVDWMYLGTRLVPHKVPKQQQATHFVALTKGDSCEVKIHFDLDFDVEANEPKPSPHIQIGGRALRKRKTEFGLTWNDDLDKPRWPSLPYCTPLLWHAAFLEFQECASVALFVKQDWWRDLVKKAELELWSPFCKDLHAAIAQGSAIEAFYPTKG